MVSFLIKNDAHTSIFSANCTCKGGSDGYCRHVVATIFELMDFFNDHKKKSVTSGRCQWVRRSIQKSAITPIENLSIGSRKREVEHPLPTENEYNPVPKKCSLPSCDTFMEIVKKDLPSACCLDT